MCVVVKWLLAQAVPLVGVGFQETLSHFFRYTVCGTVEVNASGAFIPSYRGSKDDQRHSINNQQAFFRIQPVEGKRNPGQQRCSHDSLLKNVIRSGFWFKIPGHPPDKHALEGIFALNVMWAMRTKKPEYHNGKNQERHDDVDDHPGCGTLRNGYARGDKRYG